MSISQQYRPPGVYTSTDIEIPEEGFPESVRIPAFIGEGIEQLTQTDLEIVRGSSAVSDQQVVEEDETGRAVQRISATGVVTLTNFDGVLTKFRVQHYPIVDGNGLGTPTQSQSDVQVFVEERPAVVLSVDGVRGVIELVQAPEPNQTVRCTYFFKRTDTWFTDDVSTQVSPDAASITALTGIADVDADDNRGEVLTFREEQIGPSGQIVIPGNNRLTLTVDRVSVDIRIAPGRYTMRQAANAISAAHAQTLRASTLLNNLGLSTLVLKSDHDLEVTGGSASTLLGLQIGQRSERVRTFTVSEGPIVDGSNGGITTTDPSKVSVLVNGEQVLAEAVNGAARTVQLSLAPKVGAQVVISYWANTWQDTYDYLAHRGITKILRVGDVPGRSSYTEGSDYILDDDRILWGASWSVSPNPTPPAEGYVPFGEAQIGGFLLDDRDFLALCSPVVQNQAGQVTQSSTVFICPRQPTLGNGRDTPLGQTLFNLLANGRVGTPSNRPDLIWAYWGYDPQDALLRGRKVVVSTNGSQFTLAEPVPVGANVYATYFYNRLQDVVYKIRCERSGSSTFGTYRVLGPSGQALYCAIYDQGSKSPALQDVSIEWPGGSDLASDARIESFSDPIFRGPVEETLTVHMASKDPTTARYSLTGPAPFQFVRGYSDRARIRINNKELLTGLAGMDLGDPANLVGFGSGFPAILVGAPISYTGGPGAQLGRSYTIERTEELVLDLDGIQITAQVPPRVGATHSLVRDCINLAVNGWQGPCQDGTLTTVTLPALPGGELADRFRNWQVTIGDGAAAATPGQTRTVVSYDPTTKIATLNQAWSGGAVVKNDQIRLRDPSTHPEMKGETLFDAAITIEAGAFDLFSFLYQGVQTGSTGTITAQIPAGIYPTPGDLAIALEIAIALELQKLASKFAGLQVTCRIDGDGRFVVAFSSGGLDQSGFLALLDSPKGVGTDFCVLAGFDTGSSISSGQAILVDGPVAYAPGVAAPQGDRPTDRMLLRSRLVPGRTGSVSPVGSSSRTSVKILTGSAVGRAGFAVGDYAEGCSGAIIQSASILLLAGFGIGQEATTAEPLVVFYDGTGSKAANDELRIVVDGVSLVFRFASSPGGTVTPIGPYTNPKSVMAQVVASMVALPGQPFGPAGQILSSGTVRREGSGVRITSIRFDERSIISVGESTAASILGVGVGDVFERQLVSARVLASALNAHRSTSVALYLLHFDTAPTTGTFGAGATASVEKDLAGLEYVHIATIPISAAGYGTSSQIGIKNPTQSGRVTRSWLAYGTGVGSIDGDGDVGEPKVDGFYVTSDNPNGSGSANDSILNPGVGQDGLVGQTYRDRVTGVTFTIMPRGWAQYPSGPWQSYPTGAATFNIRVMRTIPTDANLPRKVIPGVELRVADTIQVKEGDYASFRTLDRRGLEPQVGALYYVTYRYRKSSYAPALFTRQDAVEAVYGKAIPENAVSLASYLAFLNGSVVVAIRQTPRQAGVTTGKAPLSEYVKAIQDLESPIGDVSVDMPMILRGDSKELMQVLVSSNAAMSAPRIKHERTSIFGLSAGSAISVAKDVAQSLKDPRARLVYPDVAFINLIDENGASKQYFVDGTFLAAALSGLITSPRVDVATPWVGRKIAGFAGLGRRLSEPQANEVAVAGTVVIQQVPGTLRVRDARTTDVTNVLTREPTVVLISDEIQKESRVVLDPFIGIKYLSGVAGQIEGRLANYLKFKKKAQIIRDYRDVKALPGSDAVSIVVAAKYAPVLPLLYIDLKYTLTDKLDRQ